MCFMQQAEATFKRQAERAEAFVAPVEKPEPTVEEKRKRKRAEPSGGEDAAEQPRKRKKGERKGKVRFSIDETS